MATALNQSIVLAGFMGAGKTTLAAGLAGELGVRWSDSDAAIEEAEGRTISEIFSFSGEEAFRAREAATVLALLGGNPQVIALGGGALGDPAVREALEGHVVVFVDVSEAEAWDRVSGGDRPLAQDRDSFAALYRERRPQYLLAADAIVPAAGVEAALLAPALASMAADPAARPDLLWAIAGRDQYPCWVGEGALSRAPWPLAHSRRIVVSDSNVADLYAGHVPEASGLIEIPAGEASKTLETAGRVWQSLAGQGVTRADCVVALGGGVVGDLAGFCASCYQRGVPVVQAPTSLVAQVDSAYGGKTGVDLPEAKNYVGAYHQPTAVIADTATLQTLTPEEVAAGKAEVIKTGLIAGGGLWARIAAGEPLDSRMIRDCAWTKISIVAGDERDDGGRQLLNLGHTVGHAIETVTGYERFRHGEAVGLGLLTILRCSGAGALRDEVSELLRSAGLPTEAPGLDVDAVVETTKLDKKRKSGDVPFVLCEAPGDVTYGGSVADSVLHAAVSEIAG